MPAPATPHPSTATTPLRQSRNGTAPPMPPEVTKEPASTEGPAALDRFRTMMAPLRRMMRRTFHRT
jgi:hypothetical protein